MPDNSTATFNTYMDYIYLGAALFCVTCASIAAGLTIGLLSLDTLKLKIKLVSGTEDEKRAAAKILPVLSHHHYLLTTLLLFNAAANEALPIFLDALLPSWAAIVLSVTVVLLFGEILPTAFCTGPRQLQIAASFCYFVRFLQLLLSPVAYPLAITLDYFMGDEEEDNGMNRDEISAMVQIFREEKLKQHNVALEKPGKKVQQKSGQLERMDSVMSGDIDLDNDEPLTHEELNVMTGVLGLAKVKARDKMIPLEIVNMLSSQQLLTREVRELIMKVGHSRLPVFRDNDTSNIIGFFLIKNLINIDSDLVPLVQNLPLIQPVVLSANSSLLDAMAFFQQSHTHMAIVSEHPHRLRRCLSQGTTPPESCAPMGILTIEDLFESMILADITDEKDRDTAVERERASITLREMSFSSQSLGETARLSEILQHTSTPIVPPFRQSASGPSSSIQGVKPIQRSVVTSIKRPRPESMSRSATEPATASTVASSETNGSSQDPTGVSSPPAESPTDDSMDPPPPPPPMTTFTKAPTPERTIRKTNSSLSGSRQENNSLQAVDEDLANSFNSTGDLELGAKAPSRTDDDEAVANPLVSLQDVKGSATTTTATSTLHLFPNAPKSLSRSSSNQDLAGKRSQRNSDSKPPKPNSSKDAAIAFWMDALRQANRAAAPLERISDSSGEERRRASLDSIRSSVVHNTDIESGRVRRGNSAADMNSVFYPQERALLHASRPDTSINDVNTITFRTTPSLLVKFNRRGGFN